MQGFDLIAGAGGQSQLAAFAFDPDQVAAAQALALHVGGVHFDPGLGAVGEQAPGKIPPAIVDALRGSELSRDMPLAALLPDLVIEQVRNAWQLQHGGDPVATLSVDEVNATYSAQQVAWVEIEIEFSTSLSAAAVEELSIELRDWFVQQPGCTLGGESKERRARRLVNERLGC